MPRQLGIEWNGPEAGDPQGRRGAGRDEERLDGVAVAAVVAAHVLDVAEQAIGPLRQRGHRARDHAACHLGRDRHEQERGPRPEKIGVLDGPLGARRQIEHQQIERSPLERRRGSRRGARTPSWRATCATLPAPRSRTRAPPTPGSASPSRRPRSRSLVRGSATLWLPGTNSAPWTPAMRACDGPLKSASRIAIRSPRARSAPARCSVKRALADAALAGAHRHEMAHAGEPVGDAGALLGHLLEDPGPSVADDVVVALHVMWPVPPRLGRSRRRGVEADARRRRGTRASPGAPSRSRPGGPSGTGGPSCLARGVARAAASGGRRRPRRTSAERHDLRRPCT